jgi:hypothetical protein
LIWEKQTTKKLSTNIFLENINSTLLKVLQFSVMLNIPFTSDRRSPTYDNKEPNILMKPQENIEKIFTCKSWETN